MSKDAYEITTVARSLFVASNRLIRRSIFAKLDMHVTAPRASNFPAIDNNNMADARTCEVERQWRHSILNTEKIYGKRQNTHFL